MMWFGAGQCGRRGQHAHQNLEKFSPIDWLGKLFFPRLAPWQRRQKLRWFGWALAGGVAMGVLVVMVILMQHFR